MIEWIIGAAVLGLGALLGDNKKVKKTGTAAVRSSLLDRPPTIDRNSIFSEWRTEWEPTVDRARWIPKRLASEIIQDFPPHENGTSTPKPSTDLSRFEKALCSEFEAHNAKFLKDQKDKLRDFFAAVEHNPLTDEQSLFPWARLVPLAIEEPWLLGAGRIMNRFWAVPLFPDAGQLRLFQARRLGHLILAVSLNNHHMTVTVFADSEEKLENIASEVRNIAATEGVNLVNESFAARSHYFAQHPGNGQMRSRKAAITNMNFADLAALHRSQLGKTGDQVPWGKPITIFPTPERSGFLFNYHEVGQPDKEPTGGHTLILGRPGSGKSVLSAFLMTQARRCGARVFVFDYRLGMEMAVRANGGRYSAIKAGEVTGLNRCHRCH